MRAASVVAYRRKEGQIGTQPLSIEAATETRITISGYQTQHRAHLHLKLTQFVRHVCPLVLRNVYNPFQMNDKRSLPDPSASVPVTGRLVSA